MILSFWSQGGVYAQESLSSPLDCVDIMPMILYEQNKGVNYWPLVDYIIPLK